MLMVVFAQSSVHGEQSNPNSTGGKASQQKDFMGSLGWSRAHAPGLQEEGTTRKARDVGYIIEVLCLEFQPSGDLVNLKQYREI